MAVIRVARMYRAGKIAILTLWIGFFFSGCNAPEPQPAEKFLIRVADRMVTVSDFNRAMELAKTAYPHNALQDKETLRMIQFRLLNQFIEEMMLLERAEELNILVTEEDVERAVEEIKEDYPDDTFEQTVLENALPFDVWKNRLKVRLTKEKVIAEELEKHISITNEDVSNYIARHYSDDRLGIGAKDVDELIVKSLRREKAESAYSTWITKLQARYMVEINDNEWLKLIGS
jgi:SurA-like protein